MSISIYKDKKLICSVYDHFNKSLRLAVTFDVSIDDYAEEYNPFDTNDSSEYMDFFRVLEEIFLKIMTEIEHNIYINLHDFNLININEILSICSGNDKNDVLNMINKHDVYDTLNKSEVLDIPAEYILPNTNVCSWSKLFTIIDKYNYDCNSDKKKFIIMCYKKFDKIFTHVISRLKEYFNQNAYMDKPVPNPHDILIAAGFDLNQYNRFKTDVAEKLLLSYY